MGEEYHYVPSDDDGPCRPGLDHHPHVEDLVRALRGHVDCGHDGPGWPGLDHHHLLAEGLALVRRGGGLQPGLHLAQPRDHHLAGFGDGRRRPGRDHLLADDLGARRRRRN